MNHEEYELLTKPLTRDELFVALRETCVLTGVVEVGGGDFLDAATDGPDATIGDPNVESVHRLLSERLTGTTVLRHISYRILSSEGGTMHIEVTGDATLVVIEIGISKPTVVPDNMPLGINRPDFDRSSRGREDEKNS